MAVDLSALVFAIVDIVGVIGILVWHVQGKDRPTARLIIQILFFAAMTATFLSQGILPFRVTTGELEGLTAYLGKSAHVLWWVHLAWATIGFVRLYIALDRRPQEARLIQDLIVAGVYLGVALSLSASCSAHRSERSLLPPAWLPSSSALPSRTPWATCSLAWPSHLAVRFTIGDWIQLDDGTEGRVIQNNWRSTQILTPAHNVVVLPNSALAKLSLTNLTRPDESHLVVLAIRIATDRQPSAIEAILVSALEDCRFIVQEPKPVVAFKGIDAIAIDVELLFRVTSPANRVPARNEIIDVVSQQCATHGLGFAMPAQAYLVVPSLGDKMEKSGSVGGLPCAL